VAENWLFQEALRLLLIIAGSVANDFVFAHDRDETPSKSN
jgi:hypothetical protein